MDNEKDKKLPQEQKTEKSALDKKAKQQKEIEAFKRKYFDYYDDIKISVKEDW